uniref:potassium channel subfamily K member 1-like n=1 Tax=Myxine glutinosa TaxID=7769 RepID=UPI00358F1766
MSMHLWPGCAITALVITHAAYLAFGAWLFLALERPGEIQYQKDLQKIWEDFLQEHECVDGASLKEFVEHVLSGKMFAISALKNTTSDLLWSYPSSLLFVSTLLTTVGYGYTVPVSSEGKVLCIVYVVLGIPLTLLLVSAIVQRLVLLFTCRSSHHLRIGAEVQHTIPCLHALVLVCFAGIAFIFIPAVAFSALEKNWDFTSALYFCIVSLTTIGLGDYVPGQGVSHHFHGLYMISISIYLLLGVATMIFILEISSRLHFAQRIAAFFMPKMLLSEEERPILTSSRTPTSCKGSDASASIYQSTATIDGR